jgi:hypothetical protein
MPRDITQKSDLNRIFLGLSSIEGIAALIWYFSEPSMDKNAWMWGYSKPRLLLSILFIFFVLLIAMIAIKTWRDRPWVDKLSRFIDEKANDEILSWAIVFVLSSIIIGLALTLILISPLGNYVSIVEALFRRSVPLFAWLIIILIQVVIVGRMNYFERFKRISWRDAPVWRPLLTLSIVIIYIIHWTILIFRLDLLTSIPGWFWIFHEKSYTFLDFYLLGIFLIPLFLIVYILRSPDWKWNILLVILLGLFLQYAFGFVEGGGFDSIRRKYADTQHSAYAMHASDKPDLYNAIATYEQAYGDQRYLQTKPPGVLTFYILTQKVSNLIQPEKNFDGRFQRLTWFITFTYPLLSLLVVIVLYMLLTPLVGKERAIVPCILYVISPNVALMPLYLDQVVYPPVFTFGAWLFMQVNKTQSFYLAVAAGIGCYIAMFLSFSLITILPFALVLIALDYLVNRKDRLIVQSLKLCAGLIIGVLLAYAGFYTILHYDFFTRYENMMVIHRYDDFVARFGVPANKAMAESGYKPGLGQILYAIFLNNITFAAWAGFPVYLLFLIGLFRTALSYIKRNTGNLEVLLGGFGVTFIALNLFGDTTGEVARLWIFMLPIMLIYASKEINILFKSKHWGFYLIAAAQLITVILTYKFQDFIL